VSAIDAPFGWPIPSIGSWRPWLARGSVVYDCVRPSQRPDEGGSAMGWRDKLKAGAEEVKSGAGEATARARETMHDAQVRHELQNAYTELGRTTYTLVDEGSLKDERLDNAVARIRELGSQLVDSQPPSQ
jgi:hypothetical protein